MKRDSKNRPIFTRRALVLGGAQVAAFGALSARLYNMQVVQHGDYAKLARDNSISERLTAPRRGLITDRFGTVVAGNRQHWRALFMKAEAPDPDAVLARFSSLVPLDDDERARIADDIAHHPRYIPVLLKDYLDWGQMAAIEVNAPDLPGVLVDVGASRLYPFTTNFAHTVGYVARPNQKDAAADPVLALPGMRIGRSGVEAEQDDVLRGTPGFVQSEVNVHGEVVREVARDDGTPGATVALGLDTGMQLLANQLFANQTGAAVVLDVISGEVLAMASSPSFDPSLFDRGVPQAQWDAWMADEKRPLTNRAIAGYSAPGSTFKPTVALAALTCGSITPETLITCPGFLKLGDHIFWCDGHVAHGTIPLATALQVSCDVFFYNVALRTGIDLIAAMAHNLGIGTDIGIDLPNALPGFVPTHAWARERHLYWAPGNTVEQGIGQGYTQVTPLALATMIARVATGTNVVPHITRRVGGVLVEASTPGQWQPLDIDDRHLAAVRQGLFEVVNTPAGTAYTARLQLPGVQMAGKTGTAQVHNNTAAEKMASFNDANLPWKFRPNGLFVGYAPLDNPRYAAAALVEHGVWGGTSAAPIVRDLITYALTNDPAGRDTPLNKQPAPPLSAPPGPEVSENEPPT
jgi:penicillin-binding protein 2